MVTGESAEICNFSLGDLREITFDTPITDNSTGEACISPTKTHINISHLKSI